MLISFFKHGLLVARLRSGLSSFLSISLSSTQQALELFLHAPTPSLISPQVAPTPTILKAWHELKYHVLPRPISFLLLAFSSAFSLLLCVRLHNPNFLFVSLAKTPARPVCTPRPAHPKWILPTGQTFRNWTFRTSNRPIPSLARLPSCKATGLGAGEFFFFYLWLTAEPQDLLGLSLAHSPLKAPSRPTIRMRT